MDTQTERDLAQEARRGARALFAMYATAIYGWEVMPLTGMTRETRLADRDRANGTITTLDGKVYSAETVRQWALEDAAKGRPWRNAPRPFLAPYRGA